MVNGATDSDGAFVLDGTDLESVTLTFSKGGYAVGESTFWVEPGVQLTGVEIRLDPVGVISGLLLDETADRPGGLSPQEAYAGRYNLLLLVDGSPSRISSFHCSRCSRTSAICRASRSISTGPDTRSSVTRPADIRSAPHTGRAGWTCRR